MMSEELFYNGIFHSMKEEGDTFSFMTVSDGIITGTFNEMPEGRFGKKTDLQGMHVYPCLIDGHIHLLYTIAVMAMGFDICKITKNGVKPDNMKDVEKTIREFASSKGKNDIIAANNYIMSAVDEKRMPSKSELDDWAGGRAMVVYNIDGHTTALSSAMLEKIGIDPVNHDGVLTGEENERNQGKITDVISSGVGLKTLAKGIAIFHNECAKYGICMVGALEGNGDSEKDITTKIIAHLARHFDIETRLYLQYTDFDRVKPYIKYMKHPRLGGCGDWEMDGSVGSHSAAFYSPYKDTGNISQCYYTQDFVNKKVAAASERGWQLASHAIGDAAIDRIMEAMNANGSSVLNRIEHIEFISDSQIDKLDGGKYAVMMQPGYAWIDKRYLHTYSMYLPENIEKNLKLKSISEKGVAVCASTDSPVQSMNPYLQMLGMCSFYNEKESLSNYEALKAYTVNPAKAMLESDGYGTLEKGKTASFFTSDKDILLLEPDEIADFLPCRTWYGAKPYKKKKGTAAELLAMLMRKPKKI